MLKAILHMLESKKEKEQSVKDICKIDAGKSVESTNVAPAIDVKSPEIVDAHEKVEQVDTRIDTDGVKHDRTPEIGDEPDKVKSMDTKVTMGRIKNQENTPEIVDETEKAEKVDDKSYTDGDKQQDKIGTALQDMQPDSIDASKGIGYVNNINSVDTGTVTMNVKEKLPECITYKVELSLEEREEGRPPDGVTENKTVSFSERVNTAEINVSTELDDTEELNELVVEEHSDEVPTIKGGDIPIGECDGFYDLDSTPPCSQLPRIDLYKKQQNKQKASNR